MKTSSHNESAAGRIRITVGVRDDGFHGFYCDGVHWPAGTTEAEVTPDALERMLAERQTYREAFRMTITRHDIGELLAPLPPEERLSKDELWERERARALEIERRQQAEEAERREREANAQYEGALRAAEARDFAEKLQQRREEDERLRRVLAEHDAKRAEIEQQADEAAEAKGVWRTTTRADGSR